MLNIPVMLIYFTLIRGVNEPECTGTAFQLEFVQPECHYC